MLKEKLIKVRKDKKFSQQDMAEHLNISQAHYSRKEKGEVEIHDEEWERIARLLDVKIKEIKQPDKENMTNQNFKNIIDTNRSNYFNVPEYILKNQQDYITILKKEIEILKTRISELEKK